MTAKVESHKSNVTEHFVTGHGVNITVTPWSNYEGANVLIQEDRHTLGNLSLRWEEIDLLVAALSLAKAG